MGGASPTDSTPAVVLIAKCIAEIVRLVGDRCDAGAA